MQILEFKPVEDRGAGMQQLAAFDLQLTDDVRLYGLRLMEVADGTRLVYAAQSGLRRTATFTRDLAAKITKLAVERMEAITAHANSRH